MGGHLTSSLIGNGNSLIDTVQPHQTSVLHLFDGPHVTLGERRMEVPEGSKKLLVFVALHRRRIERRQIAGALWPIGDEGRAAGNLRSALWRLRGAGIDLLVADKWSLALCDQVIVDINVVNNWAGRLIDGTASTHDLTVLPCWADALDLLPGWYDDWVLLERELIRQRVLHALEALTRRLVLAGRCAEAVEAAMLAVGAEPLRESAQRALIETHLAEGNRMEGWRAYHAYRELLLGELGVEPSADLRALLQPPRVDRSDLSCELPLQAPSSSPR
ncbi:MAG: AfsR/SARP family transcriptional regulator [Pseudonocardiaceae bacterium]